MKIKILKNMLIVFICLVVEFSKFFLIVIFIIFKCIFIVNSIINVRVVKVFVNICKIKLGIFVCFYF